MRTQRVRMAGDALGRAARSGLAMATLFIVLSVAALGFSELFASGGFQDVGNTVRSEMGDSDSPLDFSKPLK